MLHWLRNFFVVDQPLRTNRQPPLTMGHFKERPQVDDMVLSRPGTHPARKITQIAQQQRTCDRTRRGMRLIGSEELREADQGLQPCSTRSLRIDWDTVCKMRLCRGTEPGLLDLQEVQRPRRQRWVVQH